MKFIESTEVAPAPEPTFDAGDWTILGVAAWIAVIVVVCARAAVGSKRAQSKSDATEG